MRRVAARERATARRRDARPGRPRRPRRPVRAPALGRPAAARRARPRARHPSRACCCSTSRSSALDAKVRVQLRDEIRRIQRELAITTLFVTHDQEEALAVADRVAVMRAGRHRADRRARRSSTRRPRRRSSRSSSGTSNRLRAEVVTGRVRLPGRRGAGRGVCADGPVWAYVRPEDVVFADRGLAGMVEQVSFRGAAVRSSVRTAGDVLVTLDHRADRRRAGRGHRSALAFTRGPWRSPRSTELRPVLRRDCGGPVRGRASAVGPRRAATPWRRPCRPSSWTSSWRWRPARRSATARSRGRGSRRRGSAGRSCRRRPGRVGRGGLTHLLRGAARALGADTGRSLITSPWCSRALTRDLRAASIFLLTGALCRTRLTRKSSRGPDREGGVEHASAACSLVPATPRRRRRRPEQDRDVVGAEARRPSRPG